MGRDKALLPFNSYDTLTEYQYERLKPYFKKTYISCKDRKKFNFNANFIEDIETKEHSPLIGFISVFENIEDNAFFTLSVDAPFFNIKDFEKLYRYKDEDYDALIAKEKNGKTHPLCGIYKRSILPLFKEALSKERHKIKDILEKAKTLYIEFEEEKIFTNLNYPEDYQNAKRMLNG